MFWFIINYNSIKGIVKNAIFVQILKVQKYDIFPLSRIGKEKKYNDFVRLAL